MYIELIFPVEITSFDDDCFKYKLEDNACCINFKNCVNLTKIGDRAFEIMS